MWESNKFPLELIEANGANSIGIMVTLQQTAPSWKTKFEHLVKQGLLNKDIAQQKNNCSKDKETRKKRQRSRSRGRQTLETSDEEKDRNRQPQEVRGIIDYIAGGFTRGGETSSARKRHLRAIMNMESNPPRPLKMPSQVILFSDHNFKRTDQNMHDLMVISVVVRNYIVWKVPVDQGSSTNILYAFTLQKCKYQNPILTYTMEIGGVFQREG